MLHEITIVLHATSAVVCFAFGYWTLLPGQSGDARRRVFGYYLLMLVAMIVSLGGAILAHLSRLSAVERLIFPGLFLLSVYMLARALQARAELRAPRSDWFPRYVNHVGFTLIALFEGFIIVAGIDLRVPGWVTAGVAVGGVIAGNQVLRRVKP